MQRISANALQDFVQALGPDSVVGEEALLAQAERATFQTSQRIPLILKPRDRRGVQEVLRIGNRHSVAIYPVSSGKNWGYGSSVPVTSGCALLDLSRMKAIVDFDEELGYVTVQPGVTQCMLFDFLREKKSRLWMDATGSSPDCSILGNAIERGFGHTPYGDHFASVCGLEVVLPNGDVVETGFSGLPGAATGPIYRWGVGPSLDGLFSQSNYGVVTRLTIWLMPAPDYFQAFFFQCEDENALPGVIDALRPLRMNGTLRSAVHIGNDYKVLAGTCQFPWNEAQPLSPERMKGYRKSLKIGSWSGSGGLYGSRPQVAEARRLVRIALSKKVDKLRFFDDRMLRLASRFTGAYRILTGMDLTRTLELAKPVFGLLKGVPTTKTLGSAYWRKKMPIPSNPHPDRDGCGLLWSAPVARMKGSEAEKLVKLIKRILLGHGFEPMISLTLLTERALACIVSISYDRDVAEEDRKAMACHLALEESLEREGYYPYRLGIASMQLQSGRGAYSQLLDSLKDALDPKGILAPGRYISDRDRERIA